MLQFNAQSPAQGACKSLGLSALVEFDSSPDLPFVVPPDKLLVITDASFFLQRNPTAGSFAVTITGARLNSSLGHPVLVSSGAGPRNEPIGASAAFPAGVPFLEGTTICFAVSNGNIAPGNLSVTVHGWLSTK